MTADDWPVPHALVPNERRRFPVQRLPWLLRDAVEHIAETRIVDPVLPFTAYMGCISGVFAEGMTVQITPSWVDPLNVYCLVVASSGDGKSPAFAPAGQLLGVIEQERVDDLVKVQREARARLVEIPDEIKDAKKASDGQKLRKLVGEREECQTTIRRSGRISVQDATPESTAELMSRNGGHLVVVDAEGSIVHHALGMYSNSPNIALWLAGWSGEEYRRNRVREEGAQEMIIARTLIGVGAAIQPGVMQTLLNDPRIEDRGFLARTLSDWPPSMAGVRNLIDVVEHAKDKTHLDPLHRRVRTMWTRHRQNGHALLLDGVVRDRFVGWHDAFEALLASYGDEMRLAVPKVRASAARLAAVFHALNADDLHVELDEIDAAIEVCNYYLAGRDRSAEMAMFSDALRVLDWLADHHEDPSAYEVTRGVGWYKFRGGGKRTAEALKILMEHGWIRAKPRANNQQIVERHPRIAEFHVRARPVRPGGRASVDAANTLQGDTAPGANGANRSTLGDEVASENGDRPAKRLVRKARS